jgi:hypothetical protein
MNIAVLRPSPQLSDEMYYFYCTSAREWWPGDGHKNRVPVG